MSPIDPELRGRLSELNRRERPALARLVRSLDGRAGSTAAAAIGRLHAALTFEAPRIDKAGVRAFVRVLRMHPAIEGDGVPALAIDVRQTAAPVPSFEAGALARLALAGAMSLSTVTRDDRMRLGATLTRVLSGAGALDATFREVLLGHGVPPDPSDLLPPRVIDLNGNKLRRLALAELGQALLEHGGRMGHGEGDADGIAGLDPTTACAGDAMTIHGGFPPTRPTNTEVFVSGLGGCLQARVDTWSQQEITITLPAGVRTGCVGFVRVTPPTGSPFGSGLADALIHALGPSVIDLAERLRVFGDQIAVSCPPCLPNAANRLTAGPPVIDSFRINGAFKARARRHEPLVLTWDVANATSVTVEPVAPAAATDPAAPFDAPADPLPQTGSYTVGAYTGQIAATVKYTLTARNRCGVTTASVNVSFYVEPVLAVPRIEVVQVIQSPDNAVRLVAGKRTMVRVFVACGLGGFDYGEGPNNLPGVSATLEALLPDGSTVSAALWPPITARPAPDRSVATDSLNHQLEFLPPEGDVVLRAHVTVENPWYATPPGVSLDGETTVTFQRVPSQELQPILIEDPVHNQAAPSMDVYREALGKARDQLPVAEDGIVVNPELRDSVVYGIGTSNLIHEHGWNELLGRLVTGLFLGSVSARGLLTGLVPDDSNYAWGGLALPRLWPAPPALLFRSAENGLLTHELGHAFGLLHVPVPPAGDPDSPAGPYAGSLWSDPARPLRTEQPGVRQADQQIVPLGVPDIMSYRSDRWPTVAVYERILDRIPI